MSVRTRVVRGRRRRLVAAGVAVLALAVPAACGGSQLDPAYVRQANDAVAGGAQGSGVGGTGVTGDGTGVVDPGTGAVVDGTGATGGTGGTGTGATGGTGTGATGGTGTSTGGGGGSTGKGGGGGGSTGGGAAAGVKVGSCDGFKNQTGITDKTITIGNASDISGPVPGLFTGAQQATKAFVAYFNATSSICGRKLQLVTADSRTDAGADQQAYQKFCDSTFAAVGSMSAFDSGGAGVAQGCGLPDIRTAAVTATRTNCSTCFGTQGTGPGEYSNGPYDWMVANHKSASQKGAFLYLNAGAAAENAKTQIAVGAKRGVKWLYTSPVDVTEFNYGPYVQQMKSKGVQFVQFIGAYQQSVRLAQAMQSASFKPEVLMYDPSVYDDNFIKTGGSAVDGAVVYISFTPLDESQPELNLYKKWLQQAAPGARPAFFGMFAWSAARLFTEQLLELGGKLTRASLVQQVKGVSNWTGRGMHAAMQVGPKHPPSCLRFMQVKGGKFVPLGATKYTCYGYSKG